MQIWDKPWKKIITILERLMTVESKEVITSYNFYFNNQDFNFSLTKITQTIKDKKIDRVLSKIVG